MAYNTTQNYKKVIYSGNSNHKLRIWFDDVELENADRYCEKITCNQRILPNDGNNKFSLDNFVSQEVNLILHNVQSTQIKGKVRISIGTFVDNDYEYVPIGIFNIQDEPINDKDTITIKLRDNASLFDFPYNAKPLIDKNDGKATKMQILQDICSQANVICRVDEFGFMDDEIAIYDNTITGRTYISYLAEQCGAIPTINRGGELIFVYINDLQTQRIPLSVVEKYEIGEKFKISRVVYEDAIRKFEYPNEVESENDTLYLNASNFYISSQEQIEYIYQIVNDFEIDSLKTGKIIGDPSIDAYDIIEIYNDYDEEEPIIAKTLATRTLVYNGVIICDYETKIGLEERKENVTLVSEPNFRKFARTSINNLTNDIELLVVEQNETSEKLTQVIQNIDSIQNLFQITGGNNLIKDSQLLLKDAGLWEYVELSTNSLFPSNNVHPSNSMYPLEYYYNEPEYIGGYDSTLIGKTKAVAKIGIKNGKMRTSATNITNLMINNMYTLSFKITNEANTTTKIRLLGNGNIVYEQSFTDEIEIEEVVYSFVAQTSNYILEIQSSSNTDGFVYIYDLMLNKGDKQEWQPASGELVSTTIKLSQLGVQVYSTGSEIATLMTSEGFEIRRFQNGNLYEIVTKFTKDGFESKKGILEELQIKNFEAKVIDYKGYDTLILYKKDGDD